MTAPAAGAPGHLNAKSRHSRGASRQAAIDGGKIFVHLFTEADCAAQQKPKQPRTLRSAEAAIYSNIRKGSLFCACRSAAQANGETSLA
jgi:hypothetical protein